MQRTLFTAPIAESAASIEQLLRQAPAAAQKILRALMAAQARHGLFLPEQPIVVGVSGGADSVCLLHALYQLAPFWRLSLHVAHLDHGLRPDSADDAAFVAALAQQLSLPCYSRRLEPGILDDVPGGLEVAARSARYAFLRQVAEDVATTPGNAAISGGSNASKDAGAPSTLPVTVATAHHLDDQAETLLLHLVQGSGLTGLAGMAWVGQLPDDKKPPIRLVRPFLGVNRADIHNYLRSYGLEWREDSSNLDLAHPRNQLRHAVLPLLATINPNIHATLARTADLLAAEAEHANSRDRTALAAATVNHTPLTRIVLDWFQLTQVDLATQRGVLRQALLALGIDLRTVGMEGIDALLDQARAATASGPHPLLAGWAWTILRRSEGSTTNPLAANAHDQKGIPPSGWNDRLLLAIHRADALPIEVVSPHLGAPLATAIPIPQQDALTQNGWQLHSSLLDVSELPTDWQSRAHPWRFFGDAEKCGDLYLTTFQAGMSIAPLGMRGHRRALGDIFTDYKIEPFLRPGWPVVVNGDGMVVWLCMLAVAESTRVESTTRQVRQLMWQPLETAPAP